MSESNWTKRKKNCGGCWTKPRAELFQRSLIAGHRTWFSASIVGFRLSELPVPSQGRHLGTSRSCSPSSMARPAPVGRLPPCPASPCPSRPAARHKLIAREHPRSAGLRECRPQLRCLVIPRLSLPGKVAVTVSPLALLARDELDRMERRPARTQSLAAGLSLLLVRPAVPCRPWFHVLLAWTGALVRRVSRRTTAGRVFRCGSRRSSPRPAGPAPASALRKDSS